MDSYAVDLLECYLRDHPNLKRSILLDPPRLQWRGRWRRIARCQFRFSGLRLTLVNGESAFLSIREAEAHRQDQLGALLNLIGRGFRGWRVESILGGTDRVRHQSGAILRVLLGRGGHRQLLLVAYPDSGPSPDRMLSSALLWWDAARATLKPEGLLVCVPENWSQELVRSLSTLAVSVQCFEYRRDWIDGVPVVAAATGLERVFPGSAAASEVFSPCVLFPFLSNVPSVLLQLQKRFSSLDLTYRKGAWEVSHLGFRVAWSEPGGHLCHFDADCPRVLVTETLADFASHFGRVCRYRTFPPPNPRHFFYRYRQERWLESLVIRGHRLFNDRFREVIYSQVPSYLDGQRKVLDLLTVTDSGRLAVLELKTERNLDLIFQGLDYWERVRQHLSREEFQKAGYFRGIPLSAESPLLYLVCPLFEFHKTMPIIRRYLKRETAIQCVGVNADWKKGLRVLRRFAL